MNIRLSFSSFLKFWSSEGNTENTTSDLYFNEESDYSVESTSDSENFRPTILHAFQFEPEQKKGVVITAVRKKLNIFTLQLPIYYILKTKSRLV